MSHHTDAAVIAEYTDSYTPASGCPSTYSANGTRLESLTAAVLGTTTATSYCYDTANKTERLASTASTQNGNTTPGYRYSYDPDGNIKTGSAGSRTYNEANQLADKHRALAHRIRDRLPAYLAFATDPAIPFSRTTTTRPKEKSAWSRSGRRGPAASGTLTGAQHSPRSAPTPPPPANTTSTS